MIGLPGVWSSAGQGREKPGDLLWWGTREPLGRWVVGARFVVTEFVQAITYWLYTDFAAHLGFLLALLFLADVLRQRRSPSSTLAWLLAILLIPAVGVPLYLLLGGRKLRWMARRKRAIYTSSGARSGAEASLERLLAWYGLPPERGGNRVEMIFSGVVAFERILGLIDSARQSIEITTYILGLDATGQELLRRLTAKARSGVRVRLLLDSLGSWRVTRRRLRPFTDAGGEVAFFMPVLRLPLRGRPNLRNHRKLILFDQTVAVAGGINLAEPYIGPDAHRLWHDLSAIVEGPVVRDLATIFSSDWAFATKTTPQTPADDEPARENKLNSCSTSHVQVVASGPDVAGDPLYEALLSLCFSARWRIWIVTPYFVPDETLARAIALAARRGVDVQLIVPRHSNHLSADLARTSYLRDLHEASARVLFHDIMIHAKAVLIDDSLAVIGSANMDMRSLFLNYELALLLSSPSETRALAEWIEGLAARSRLDAPASGWARVLGENVVRLLSPLL